MNNRLLSYILFLLSLFLLPSCQEDKGRPLIPEEEMAHIIADYYIEQVTLTQFDSGNARTRFYYYTELMNKYGRTEAEFDSSLVWYTKNLDVLEKVYDRAEAILEAKRDSLSQLLDVTK